ncbi:predicted protein [Nematostella vectensis]|uniref:Uncharacterized protein n=1 Tax=Nematostella vectensis TaxID=45351 RepID=A7SBE2_NEMVE|nr:predicted protein [Nematostella vectensis]|eukprot:XP_001631052.1 predicted protein [Nematostella vectensis]
MKNASSLSPALKLLRKTKLSPGRTIWAGAETHFHEGHNLICTLLPDAFNQERHNLAKAKGYVGGGERHGNFFCGTLMDEVRLVMVHRSCCIIKHHQLQKPGSR